MKLVCLSDTHLKYSKLKVPDGDVLIHAGDWSVYGNWVELIRFLMWLKDQPHKRKIVIGGNHDMKLGRSDQELKDLFMLAGATFLEDSKTTIGNLQVWGFPWQTDLPRWEYHINHETFYDKLEMIPKGTDILISHVPPLGILDVIPPTSRFGPEDGLGSGQLLNKVIKLKPKYHIFGHIHESHGILVKDGTTFVNAAICDDDYKHAYEPIVLEI